MYVRRVPWAVVLILGGGVEGGGGGGGGVDGGGGGGEGEEDCGASINGRLAEGLEQRKANCQVAFSWTCLAWPWQTSCRLLPCPVLSSLSSSLLPAYKGGQTMGATGQMRRYPDAGMPNVEYQTSHRATETLRSCNAAILQRVWGGCSEWEVGRDGEKWQMGVGYMYRACTRLGLWGVCMVQWWLSSCLGRNRHMQAHLVTGEGVEGRGKKNGKGRGRGGRTGRGRRSGMDEWEWEWEEKKGVDGG